MKTAIPINKNLFDIYLLFTREPFVNYLTKELEFYTNGNGGLLGLISLDITDNDFYACILSRDNSKQYRAESVKASIETIEEARKWIDENMSNDNIVFHDNKHNFFDLFKDINNEDKQHPHFKLLKSNIGLLSALETIKEISYHYKDIDGNFIDQFQSKNGFDSRIWELFLYCFFREQFFSFKRDFNAPDYLIEKGSQKIAVEAVIVSRKTEIEKDTLDTETPDKLQQKLDNEVPLLFGSALFDKMKKKYWEKEHVKGNPFAIAIADFHDTMSMTWTFNGLLDYLYGYKYEHSLDENGQLITTPIKIEDYTKTNGSKIPSGFFFFPDSENVSAVIFSSCGTLSKFNRMGKQAGLGSNKSTLIRTGTFYNHAPNAIKPNIKTYQVTESSKETWSEGCVVFHNPNAKYPIDSNLFNKRVAQTYFIDGIIYYDIPEIFPYNSFTQNIIEIDEE